MYIASRLDPSVAVPKVTTAADASARKIKKTGKTDLTNENIFGCTFDNTVVVAQRTFLCYELAVFSQTFRQSILVLFAYDEYSTEK